jgi:metal-sulfur cluster biosynthetic enzyme
VISRERILDVLSVVRDPELDESITSLGFVEGMEVDGESVHVQLRLPTYWCAANFAYIMTADAKVALLSLPEVSEAHVTLIDHFSSTEINQGMALDHSFQETFKGLADGELGEVRDLFARKAFVSRQEKLCRLLKSRGHTPETLAGLRLDDLPPGDETEAYLSRRRALGLDLSRSAPFLIDPMGRHIRPKEAPDHLRFARLMATSLEANGSMCRALLANRYGLIDEEATL